MWCKVLALGLVLSIVTSGQVAGEDALGAQFPKLTRLATALQSFRYPAKGREHITIWRQSTPQIGSFFVMIADDTVSLRGAIESFEDGCKPFDLKNVAILSDAGIEFVDYTDAKRPPEDRMLTPGQLVIVLAPIKDS